MGRGYQCGHGGRRGCEPGRHRGGRILRGPGRGRGQGEGGCCPRTLGRGDKSGLVDVTARGRRAASSGNEPIEVALAWHEIDAIDQTSENAYLLGTWVNRARPSPGENLYSVPANLRNLRKEPIARHRIARWICCQANMSCARQAVCCRVRRM